MAKKVKIEVEKGWRVGAHAWHRLLTLRTLGQRIAQI
jgi:hypothetical protein